MATSHEHLLYSLSCSGARPKICVCIQLTFQVNHIFRTLGPYFILDGLYVKLSCDKCIVAYCLSKPFPHSWMWPPCVNPVRGACRFDYCVDVVVVHTVTESVIFVNTSRTILKDAHSRHKRERTNWNPLGACDPVEGKHVFFASNIVWVAHPTCMSHDNIRQSKHRWLRLLCIVHKSVCEGVRKPYNYPKGCICDNINLFCMYVCSRHAHIHI